MSKWDDFREYVGNKTSDAKEKAKKIKEKAELNLKLNNLIGKAGEEYRKLGKLYYSQEVGGVDSTSDIKAQIKAISDINKEINAARASLKAIKAEEEEEKELRETEKAIKKAAQVDEASADSETDE